jgi:hypothetical protein
MGMTEVGVRVKYGESRLGYHPVVPGFVPGIHVLTIVNLAKTWMAGTSPAMTNA